MLPFDISLRSGESPYRQVVYAATKAILGGVMVPGDVFPSVRELSQALKINPNTAQKVVAELIRDGLLVVHTGIGTVVTAPPDASVAARDALLRDGVEALVVEACRLGATRDQLLAAVDERWTSLFGRAEPSTKNSTRRGRR